MFQLLFDILSGGIARDMREMDDDDKAGFLSWVATKIFWLFFFILVIGGVLLLTVN